MIFKTILIIIIKPSMGIKNMLKFLNSNYPHIIKKVDNNFNGQMIAIDISILLYQIIIAIRNCGVDIINNQGDMSSHILGLFNKTINLLKMNIIPIYVFDGKPPEFKTKLINNRKDVKNKAHEKLNEDLTEDEKIKYFKRTVNITKKQIKECIELLELMGIPYVIAPEEADSQCAQLVKDGIADGVLTEDMDIMTFGANKIYRNLTSYKKDNLSIELNDVLNVLKINYEQFVELCILFGCDYCDRIRDVKSEEMYEIYYKYKNIPDTLENLKQKGYKIPNDFDYELLKKYFITPPVNNIKELKLKKCNTDELEKLLVNKYGLVKIKIYYKLQYLKEVTDV